MEYSSVVQISGQRPQVCACNMYMVKVSLSGEMTYSVKTAASATLPQQS